MSAIRLDIRTSTVLVESRSPGHRSAAVVIRATEGTTQGSDVDGCEMPVAQGCRIPAGGWSLREPCFGAQRHGDQPPSDSSADVLACACSCGACRVTDQQWLYRLAGSREKSVASAFAAS